MNPLSHLRIPRSAMCMLPLLALATSMGCASEPWQRELKDPAWCPDEEEVASVRAHGRELYCVSRGTDGYDSCVDYRSPKDRSQCPTDPCADRRCLVWLTTEWQGEVQLPEDCAQLWHDGCDWDEDTSGEGQCAYEGFDAESVEGSVFEDVGRYEISWSAPADAPSTAHYILLSLDVERGSPDGPFTLSLTESELDSCATCVVGYRLCDGYKCQRSFAAVSGELRVSTVQIADGARVVSSISDLRMAEVVVDAEGRTQWVEEGRDWCVDALEVDAVLRDPRR